MLERNSINGLDFLSQQDSSPKPNRIGWKFERWGERIKFENKQSQSRDQKNSPKTILPRKVEAIMCKQETNPHCLILMMFPRWVMKDSTPCIFILYCLILHNWTCKWFALLGEEGKWPSLLFWDTWEKCFYNLENVYQQENFTASFLKYLVFQKSLLQVLVLFFMESILNERMIGLG